MRLPHGTVTPGFLSLLLTLLIACGPAKPQPMTSQGLIYPAQPSTESNQPKHKKGASSPWTDAPAPGNLPTGGGESQDKTVFAARVDAEGTIHLGDAVVTEEQYLAAARKALEQSSAVVAVLLVESSIFQGIHLSEQLSKAGYKNVQIYYPTATNR